MAKNGHVPWNKGIGKWEERRCKCGKFFKVRLSNSRIGRGIYCSRECRALYSEQPKKRIKYDIKVINSGWFKPGESHSYVMKESTKKILSDMYAGKRLSIDTEFKKGSMSGNKNPMWKGGITPLNIKIRTCDKYKEWRNEVFKRDLYTCKDCGKIAGKIEAHHIKEFHKIMEEYGIKSLEESMMCEELWDVRNGKTLCKSCHGLLRKDFRK